MATSAVGAPKNQIHPAYYTDAERNRTDDKALAFRVVGNTVNTASSGGIQVSAGTYTNGTIGPVSSSFNLTTGLFTAPVEGFYLFGVNGIFATDGTGSRRIAIMLNGQELNTNGNATASATNPVHLSAVGGAALLRGDTIGLGYFQNSGSNLNLTAVNFWGCFIGSTGKTATALGTSL